MRLAVSTLGMPGEKLPAAIVVASGHGCDGLELRLHPDTGVHAGLSLLERTAVRRAVSDADLSIATLAGYIRIAQTGRDTPVIEALQADLELAADLGAPAVRVFPGGDDIAAGARRLRAVADFCRERRLRVLVETHDALPTGAGVATLLDAADRPEAAAIWDVLHPWRNGEPPTDTVKALGDHLAYVQIKDAASAANPTPRRLGSGAVPLEECGEQLRGFGGWVSLEWERTWYPQVEPVERVLPGAVAWVARYGWGS
ncbi:sugar phosphate isomerase/epimerase family protein [Acrocarpospora catenulata]|uniref:sugar phosphate isomerase/epimerase family protein n=1 Tax=Acrocarpospora catenulata TaxID=2836182 RepID=UPI001BD928EF|nr:sugar phosphate isomerase/epimerase family protein [Acrocarpospora catenulata]